MTKEDFALLRESLEQAVAFKQGNKTAARGITRGGQKDAFMPDRSMLRLSIDVGADKMSNDDAIKRIKDHALAHKMSDPRAYFINIALHKAISALEQIDEAKEIVVDLLNQFAYTGQKDGRAMVWTGGLSALESGFSFVGWDDPHFTPESECDHEGCYELATSGTPTPIGYKWLCSRHYQELKAEQN